MRRRRRGCSFARCQRADAKRSSPHSRRCRSTRGWTECPADWRAPFLPEARGVWGQLPNLRNLFVADSSGTLAGRTWVISPDKETLELRWAKLVSEKDLIKKEELFHPTLRGGAPADRHVNKVIRDGLPGYLHRSVTIAGDSETVVPQAFTLGGVLIANGSFPTIDCCCRHAPNYGHRSRRAKCMPRA